MYTQSLGRARWALIQFWVDKPQPWLGRTFEIRIGKYSTELAKMIGTTPPVFTFIGMYVLWPPYMRRPTTRLAKVTGMRRWPCSMNTMATSRINEMMMMTTNLATPASCRMALPPDGMVATTLVKIRTDMPWPMPRWVMSSPSHMTTTVPAVMVSTMSSTRGTVKLGTRSVPAVDDN